MKLKKFHKRVRHSLKEAGLAEVAPKVKKPGEYLLGSLLAFGLILIVGYLVLPFALHPKQKAVTTNNEQTLTYTLKNQSGKTWKNVAVTVQGDIRVTRSNPMVSWGRLVGEDGVFSTFPLGNIDSGSTKTLIVYARSDIPDDIETIATFKDASGASIHLPVTQHLIFP